MDRNQVIGLALMAALWFSYWWLFAPEEETAVQPQTESPEGGDAQEVPGSDGDAFPSISAGLAQLDSVANPDSVVRQLPAEWVAKWGDLAPALLGDTGRVALENEVLKVEIGLNGGMPVHASLLAYQRYGEEGAVQLWDEANSSMRMVFPWNGAQRDLSELRFKQVASGDSSIVLEAQGSQGMAVRWEYRLDGYALEASLSWIGMSGSLQEATTLAWKATGLRNEKGLDWERQHSAIYYKEQGQGRDYLSDGRADETITELPLEWLAFKQNYFSALVAVSGGFAPGATLKSEPAATDSATMVYDATLPIPLSASGVQELSFFLGPNELNALEATGLNEAERIIDYGWWIFGWLNRNFVLPLYNLLSTWTAHVGLIILLITLVIKLILSPVTWKNYLSSAKMRVLKPEMDAITAEHKDDAVARQQAMMTLYRETGVNPLAGCIPALLQAPLLYAMFRFFPSNIDLRGKSFLWADDLGAYDTLVSLPFHIPFYGAHISGFTVLMAASTFFYMRLTMASQPQQVQQPGMPNMQVIQQIFPFMMLIFFNGFAAGLSLYYLVANVISIGQMYAIKALFIDEEKIRAKIDANKATPKKKSSFQQRLEEMQAEQQRKTKELKAARKKS